MRNVVTISLAIFVALLISSAAHSQSHQRADRYWNSAEALRKKGSFLEAAQMYAKSAEAERKSPVPRLIIVAAGLGHAGICYKQAGQYDKAIKHYQQALDVERTLGREDQIATLLKNSGTLYKASGQYDKAIKHYQQALDIVRKLGHEGKVARLIFDIGQVYAAWRQYDKAIKHYQQVLDINRRLGREDGIFSPLISIGDVYRDWGQYDEASAHYQQALDIARKLGHRDDIAMCLDRIGGVYRAWGRYDEATTHYRQALNIARKLGRKGRIALGLNNIGGVYWDWGQYDKSITHYRQALDIFRKLKLEGGITTARKLELEGAIAILLNNIGSVYEAWGQYDKAIQHSQQALDIERALPGYEFHTASSLNNIGKVYKAWGRYDEAIRHYQQALDIARKLGREADIATFLSNIGAVYQAWGQYDKAVQHFQQALDTARKLGREAETAILLGNIGFVYSERRQYDKAIQHFQQALVIVRKLGRKAEIAGLLSNIGSVYNAWGQHDKAIQHFHQALDIDRRLGRESDIARSLNNMGATRIYQGQYQEAVTDLVASVELLEKLRRTAVGSARRDYLASQIGTYGWLTMAYLRSGNVAEAFHTVELSRAKLLAERLSGEELTGPSATVPHIQRGMKSNEAVLVYTNASWRDIISLVLTDTGVSGHEVSKSSFLETVRTEYGDAIEEMLTARRQTVPQQRDKGQTEEASDKSTSDLENAIGVYRYFLLPPSDRTARGIQLAKAGSSAGAEELGKMLYALLITPIKKQLEGKNALTIVPEGVFSLIPFEALVDDEGRYLVESYEIRYAQSMGVLDLIKQRKYGKRKPLLAFGGAVYDESTYSADSKMLLASLEKRVADSISRGMSLRPAYDALHVGDWDNLPGTLGEVRAIKGVVRKAKIVTGDDVNEHRIKALSEKGELAKYQVLHFATHGLVVPDVPELSALVLSQFSEEREGEDGYLRMGEIAELDLKADFVNLSACETGLGKIYAGEGVVGIAQSFLIAGANSLSLSLWKVEDDSTAQFMTSMYGLVEKNGASYAESMAEIKRRFVRGDFGEEYKNPYYWAPFVYYGP